MPHPMHPNAGDFPRDRPADLSHYKTSTIGGMVRMWVARNLEPLKLVQLYDHMKLPPEGMRASKDAISFIERDLFSFRTRIGRFVDNPNGKKIALISEERYTTITSGHISAAYSVLVRHKPTIDFYAVVDVTNQDTEANLQHLIRMYLDCVNRIEKYAVRNKHETSPPSWMAESVRQAAITASNYAYEFDLPMTTLQHITDTERAQTLWMARHKAYHSDAAVTKRSRDGAKRRLLKLVQDD